MSLFIDDTSRRLRSGWVVAIFAVLAIGADSVLNVFITLFRLYPRSPMTLDDGYLAFTSVTMLLSALVPTVVCRLAFKAEVGLARQRAPRDLAVGLGLGAALVSVTVLIPALSGQIGIALFEGSAGVVVLAGAQQLLTLGPTAVGEELMLRGVVLRQLAAGTRPWIAIALTGTTFGVLHLMNPNASPIAALNVALVGIWFGVLALRTSLWTSISAHLAWNWFEGFFYGQPVSGISAGRALFVGAVEPAGFLSGGDFGPEASGLTGLLLVIAIVATVLVRRTPVEQPAAVA